MMDFMVWFLSKWLVGRPRGLVSCGALLDNQLGRAQATGRTNEAVVAVDIGVAKPTAIGRWLEMADDAGGIFELPETKHSPPGDGGAM